MARTVTGVRTDRVARRLTAALVVAGVGAGSLLGAAGTAAAATPGHRADARVAAGATGSAATAAAATSAAAMEGQFLSLLNGHRVANHEAPLAVSADLVKVATAWSGRMAGKVGLAHNPNLATQVKNWQVVGENVGVGSDVPTLDKAFWASPEHRSNELYKTFTQVGIGVVVSGGQVWVTFDFRQPLAAVKPSPKPAPKNAAKRRVAHHRHGHAAPVSTSSATS